MRLRTFIAGNKGFLYVDLLVAMTILSITLAALFSAGINIKQSRVKEEQLLNESTKAYETLLLEEAKIH